MNRTQRRVTNKPQERRVRFSDTVYVREVPYGGRNMEPGFLARQQRLQALKLQGVRVSRKQIDDLLGNGSVTPGTRGLYTDYHARRNLWHHRKYKTPMYSLKPNATGMYVARARVANEAAKLAEMWDNFVKMKTKLPPF